MHDAWGAGAEESASGEAELHDAVAAGARDGEAGAPPRRSQTSSAWTDRRLPHTCARKGNAEISFGDPCCWGWMNALFRTSEKARNFV